MTDVKLVAEENPSSINLYVDGRLVATWGYSFARAKAMSADAAFINSVARSAFEAGRDHEAAAVRAALGIKP